LDTQRNMMVIQGGASQAGLGRGESTASDTWTLDLSRTPPRWENIGANLRETVGANMVYALRIRQPVLIGGRAKYRDRGDTQNTFRDLYGLPCAVAPTPSPEPPRPTIDPNQAKICDYLSARVPPAVINDAIANPSSIRGFGEAQNPSLPPGPNNPMKMHLGLQNPAVPFHPLFNSVLYKVGCP
jgi:hypothetical protein